jgi:alpha-1,3-rhamnosyltransferase
MSPTVSVIIPAYNHEKYIAHAMESVIAQTYNNIELVIADDRSTDGTVPTIESYADKCKQRFGNFIFIKKERNLSVADSLNQLIERVTGDIVMPLASDDMLKPRTIETLLKVMTANPDVDVLGVDCDLIDKNGVRIFWGRNRISVYDEDKASYKSFADFMMKVRPDVDFFSNRYGRYETLLMGNYITAHMYRTSAIKEVFPLERGILEDWHIMLQLSKKHKFKYIDETLYSYRWYDGNAIKNHVKMTRLSFDIVRKEKSYCRQHGLLNLYYKCLMIFFKRHVDAVVRKMVYPLLPGGAA